MQESAHHVDPADDARLTRVLNALDVIEPRHKSWMTKANHYYSLYRGYQDWRRAYDEAGPRGRDGVVRDGQKQWGAELFIPYSFSVVETQVPRMLAHNPRMLVLPRDPGSESNIENVRYVIDAQQDQIDYPLTLQSIAKDGLIYGIGVQKVYWSRKTRTRKGLTPSVDPTTENQYAVQTAENYVCFDDPVAKCVDPFDFLADPFAEEVQEAEFIIHRTWRSSSYVSKMAKAGVWRNLGEVADIDALMDGDKWNEVWKDRLRAQGYPSTQIDAKKRAMHEVLEFHDGEQVITVLDRKIVVQAGENPHWHGEYPFQIYRPTQVTHQLHGIGEVEPIEHLQEEMNTLRSQRRDNAALVLQKVFAYQDGMLDPDHLQFGPGTAIATYGDPKELLFPIQVGDIPYSGYQEEERIQGDIERTTGISEQVSGAQAPTQTATGAQLVQAAANERIKNKTMRVELEIITPGCRQFHGLNQQKILENRDVRIEVAPSPYEPDRRWAWRKIGPDQLAGEFTFKCAGGSTQAENIPQMRADAQMGMQMYAEHPMIEQRRLITWSLEQMGIKHPESWLAPPKPDVPPETLDALVDMGVPPEVIQQALASAGGPDLGAEIPPEALPQANGNGAVPAGVPSG